MTMLAEDGLPDDRVTCDQCTSMGQNGMCRFFQQRTMRTLSRRCIHFTPLRSLPDQRTGAERWPGIVQQIEEIRRMDAAHAENSR